MSAGRQAVDHTGRVTPRVSVARITLDSGDGTFEIGRDAFPAFESLGRLGVHVQSDRVKAARPDASYVETALAALAQACQELGVAEASIAFVDTVEPPPRTGLRFGFKGAFTPDYPAIIWVFANWTSRAELPGTVRHEAAHLAFARTHTAEESAGHSGPSEDFALAFEAGVDGLSGPMSPRSSRRPMNRRSSTKEAHPMRRIIVVEFLTLDGVMQAPGDPNEDPSGGFDKGGWQRDYFDDALGASIIGALAETGGFLLGRRTYEIFAAHWPKQPPEDPLASTFNDLPKWVVSSSLREPLPWQNSTLIQGDIAAAIRELRAGPGKDIQVIGSGELVQTLIQHDLVDEYRLMIHPIVMGIGKRLFRAEGTIAKLRLVDSTPTSTGVLIARYAPDRS